MLLKRFITALVLAAIGVPAIIFGGIFFWILMAFFLGVAAWEYVKLFRGANFQPSMIVVVGGVLGIMAARTLFPFYESAALTGVVLLAMAVHLIAFERGRDQAEPEAPFEKGENVKVAKGPFAGFTGTVDELFTERDRKSVV